MPTAARLGQRRIRAMRYGACTLSRPADRAPRGGLTPRGDVRSPLRKESHANTNLVTSVTASVSYSTSVKVTAGVVIDGLEASSGLTLQASGAITNTSSESVTYTMANQGVYIFYAGTRKASGSWTGAVCSSTGQYWNTSYGTAKSWTINIEGGVWCGGSRPSSGLGYYVYGQYC